MFSRFLPVIYHGVQAIAAGALDSVEVTFAQKATVASISCQRVS
jgi:hypothetical protein